MLRTPSAHRLIMLPVVIAMLASILFVAPREAAALSGQVNEYVVASVDVSGTPDSSGLDADDCALVIQMTGTIASGLGTHEVLNPATSAPQRVYSSTEAVQFVVLPDGCDSEQTVEAAGVTAPAWNGSTGGVVFLGGTTLTMEGNIDVSGLGYTPSNGPGAGTGGVTGGTAQPYGQYGTVTGGGGGGGGIFGGGGGGAGATSPAWNSWNALASTGGTITSGGMGGFDQGGPGGAPGAPGNGASSPIIAGPSGTNYLIGASGAGGGSYGAGGGSCGHNLSAAYASGGSGGGSWTGGGAGGYGGTNTGGTWPSDPGPNPDGQAGNAATPSQVPYEATATSEHYFHLNDGRIMMGGAGGNHLNAAGGGAGGGIVFLSFSEIDGAGSVLANGADGTSPAEGPSSGGGGGAGGQIFLGANSFSSLHASAVGGSGGAFVLDPTLQHTGAYGGSGGGGGIWIQGEFPDASNTGADLGATSQVSDLGVEGVSWDVFGGGASDLPTPTFTIDGQTFTQEQWVNLYNEAGVYSWTNGVVMAEAIAAVSTLSLAAIIAAFPELAAPDNPKNMGYGCGPGLGGNGFVRVGNPVPTLEVEKATNGFDSDTAPGENLVAGQLVTWTYEVTAGGAGSVSGIALTDDQIGVIDCPSTTLLPGESMTCSATGTAIAGAYANTATVTGSGTDVDGEVIPLSDNDPSHYTGVAPVVTIEKTTNGVQADGGANENPQLVGYPIAWQFDVTNSGPIALINVVVSDITDVANTTAGAETITCDWANSSDATTGAGVLSPGETLACSATGVAGQGPHENTATVVGEAAVPDESDVLIAVQDPDGEPIEVTADDPSGYDGTPTYDLALANILGNVSVDAAGTQLTYEITIKNQGQLASSAFSVLDELAPGTSFVSASNGGAETAPDSGIVQWDIPAGDSLDPLEALTLTLIVSVDDFTLTPYTNTAEVSADADDDDDSTPDATLTGAGADNLIDITDVADLDTDTNTNTPDEDDHDIAVWNPTYDLALANILVGVDSSGSSTELTHTITVKNQGDFASGAFSVLDELAPGTSFVSASHGGAETADGSGVVEWDIAAIDGANPGATLALTLVVQVDDPESAPFTNTAEVSVDAGNDDDSAPDATLTGAGADNLVDIIDVTDLDIDTNTNTPDEDDHDIAVWTPTYDLALANLLGSLSSDGAEITYQITVRNQGDLFSNVFAVTDELATGTSFVSASHEGAQTSPGIVSWIVPKADELAPGESIVLTLVAAIDDASQAPFTNTAEITADGGNDDDSTPDTTLTGPGADNLVDIIDVTDLDTDTNTNTPDEDDHDIVVVEVPLYRIGNLVWLDLDDDGVADNGEPGIGGVDVQLALPDGTLTGDSATTNADGKYAFVDVPAGDYKVVIPASQTGQLAGGNPVDLTDLLGASVSIADPDVAGDQDNDNNGVEQLSGAFESGVFSVGDPNQFAPDEPTDETLRANGADAAVDDDADAFPDAQSNYAVDFGFVEPLRVGNIVFMDNGGGFGTAGYVQANEDNGTADIGETGIAGVLVQLRDAGDTVIGEVVTDADGYYLFDDLRAGDYSIGIPSDQTPELGAQPGIAPDALDGLFSSTGVSLSVEAADDDDDGAPAAGFASLSETFELAYGLQATDEAGDFSDPTANSAEAAANTKSGSRFDENSNLEVDFGFTEVPRYRIGNLVWEDYDDDGIAEPGEPGLAGVLVQLLDASDDVIAETVTDANGKYAFDQLLAGTFRVQIPADQTPTLGAQADLVPDVLDGLQTSGTPVANADSDLDNDNNGVGDTDFVSGDLTLGNGDNHSEPEGEVDRTGSADEDEDAALRDDRSNLTVDIGLFRGLRLGNRLFLDGDQGTVTYNDGVLDLGEDGIGGAGVELWIDEDGSGDFDPAEDTLVDTTTTDTDGNYWFENLEPGVEYIVAVQEIPVSEPAEFSSSGISTDPIATDNDDDGDPESGYASVSEPVTLATGTTTESEVNTEPGDDAELVANTQGRFYPDANSELTVDFGFVDVPLYRIGNLVWEDLDNDGVAESGEPGIVGVLVQLLDDDGDVIGETATNTDGHYLFDDLIAGEYQIRIPSNQTAEGAAPTGQIADALDGFQSSTNGEESTANDDGDNNDNGLGLTDWTSSTVELGETLALHPTGDEPGDETLRADDATDDDPDSGPDAYPDTLSNVSVDFGFFQLSLGNQVWFDANDNGVIDDTEAGIADVIVELYDLSGATPALVDSVVTDASGQYLFEGLLPDLDYMVQIPTSEFASSEPLENLFSSTDPSGGPVDPDGNEAIPGAGIDGDDSGTDPVNHGEAVAAAAITLYLGDEPIGESPDNAVDTLDENDNLTLDFGFHNGLRIGSQVWFDDGNNTDDDENGRADASEAGMLDVAIQLWIDTDGSADFDPTRDDRVGDTLTDASGVYEFAHLPTGDYFVVIPASEFLAGDTLFDLVPTRGTALSDGNDDNDGTTVSGGPGAGSVTSGLIELRPDGEPTDEGARATDGVIEEDGLYPDENSNLSIDFGFADTPLFRIGNLVFEDIDNDGLAEAGEAGIPGVLVQLLDQGGDLVAETVSNTDGNYLFEGLLAGDYQVRIPSDQATDNPALSPDPGALTGMLSSSNGEELAADNDGDNNDNGLGLDDWTSAVLTLGESNFAGEPTDETHRSDDPADADPDGPAGWPDGRSNLSVDFGFYGLTLGNQVWFDANDNGIIDDDESGIEGVRVELYDTSGASPVLVETADTTSDGAYLFVGLTSGVEYVVTIPAENFSIGQPLEDHYSSTDTPAGPTDPDGDELIPGSGTDGDDNGADEAITRVDVSSLPVVLSPTDEPLGEQPDNGTVRPDENQNLTLDFGFHRGLRIGSLVWLDDAQGTPADENGTADLSESGITEVSVELWLDADESGDLESETDELVAVLATNVAGLVEFEHLPAGTYFLAVPDTEFDSAGPLYRLVSTYDGTDDETTNNDDNGVPVPGIGLVSGPIVLAPGDEPADEGANGTDGITEEDGDYADDNSNWSVDFGLVEQPTYRLGNLVWHDLDNDGSAEDGEPGIDGVLVQLLDEDDDVLYEVVTDADGHYDFDELDAGSYRVRIPVDQTPADPSLTPRADALNGYRSSDVETADANADADNDDNGITTDDGAWISGVVEIGEGILDGEPVDETTRIDDVTDADDSFPSGQPDGRSNYSVDFGFYRLTIGNQVFFDWDNSGALDAPNETGVPDVVVNLIDPTDDSTVATQATGADGTYLFASLVDDADYIVEIAAENFTAGGVLHTYLSSDGPEVGADPDLDPTDDDDNGSDSNPLDGVRSDVITIDAGNEPIDEVGLDNDAVTPDAAENRTVDFGFYTTTIGNTVWLDIDDDGRIDSGEPGIGGVAVNLVDPASGTILATTDTDANGYYLFTGVPEGTYTVALDPSNFVADADGSGPLSAGPLHGLSSSDPTSPAGDDSDEGDDGSNTPNPESSSFEVIAGEAPTATGSTANALPGVPLDNQHLNIDFGLHGLSVGNLVFIDLNGDGVFDETTEHGRGEVPVELWVTDASGDPVSSTPLATSNTDANGHYLFTNLEPGTYAIAIDGAQLAPGGPLFGYISTVGNGSVSPDADDNPTDGDDNGDPLVDHSVWTKPFDLAPAAEPVGEDDTSSNPDHVDHTSDNNSNLTIDLGFEPRVGLAVGNRVWHDEDGDGTRDTNEVGVDGVRVELLDESGQMLTWDTTENDGYYLFLGLEEGDYQVAVAASNFDEPSDALWGYFPPADLPGEPTDPDDDVDNDDEGSVPEQPFVALVSQPVTLIDLFEPMLEDDLEPPEVHLPSDPNDNLTVDFGLVRLALGGTVFADPGEDGTYDDTDEPIAGVTVHLLDESGQPVIDGSGSPISTTTDDDGNYLFEGIAPGTYIVEVAQESFDGGPLSGWASSRGSNEPASGLSPDPEGDNDNDDNGDPSGPDVFVEGPVRSQPITIAPASEPLDEELAPASVNVPDSNENLTVDLGFFEVPLMELGGNVWLDHDNSGRVDGNEPPAPADVVVRLLDENGVPVVGPDAAPVTTLTDENGDYVFGDLQPGTFIVEVAAENVQNDGVLDDYSPSTGPQASTLPDDDELERSDGTEQPDRSIRAEPVVLYPETETETDGDPVGATTADDHSNRTVDFGLYAIDASGHVWADNDGDGEVDDDERPLPGTQVALLDEDRVAIRDSDGDVIEVLTDDEGDFTFEGIREGSYRLALPPENFADGSPLGGLVDTTIDKRDDFDPETGLVSIPFEVSASERGDDPTISIPSLDLGFRSASEDDAPDALAYTGSQAGRLVNLSLALLAAGALTIGASKVGTRRRSDDE